MPNKLSSFVWDFYPWLRWKDSNLRIEGSKPSVLPLHYTPLKSIASHPFYGSFLYISEIIVAINPR